MLKFVRVVGDSLEPAFRDGDYVLVISTSWISGRLKPGDVVVFEQPPYGRMIKRIAGIQPERGELTVEGSHPASVDSRLFGAIQTRRVAGKVVWHICRPVEPQGQV
jgi:signal peptidase I